MVDVLYQSRLKDMSNFLEDEWLSPEPVRGKLSFCPVPQLGLHVSGPSRQHIALFFVIPCAFPLRSPDSLQLWADELTCATDTIPPFQQRI